MPPPLNPPPPRESSSSIKGPSVHLSGSSMGGRQNPEKLKSKESFLGWGKASTFFSAEWQHTSTRSGYSPPQSETIPCLNTHVSPKEWTSECVAVKHVSLEFNPTEVTGSFFQRHKFKFATVVLHQYGKSTLSRIKPKLAVESDLLTWAWTSSEAEALLKFSIEMNGIWKYFSLSAGSSLQSVLSSFSHGGTNQYRANIVSFPYSSLSGMNQDAFCLSLAEHLPFVASCATHNSCKMQLKIGIPDSITKSHKLNWNQSHLWLAVKKL